MDTLQRLLELRDRGEPVALATVVASRRPASARPGDRALVLAGGDLIGWIGGSCAQPTVQREGLRALADGQPRLIRLSPEAGLLPPQEGVVEDVMTCHSGGTLEIYVEPFLPTPWLLVTGDSPIAEALATLGALDDFRVRRDLPKADPHPPAPSLASRRGGAGPGADSPDGGLDGLPGGERYVVVAGMSGEDELDLERALALDPAYIAFVGSRKRLGEVTVRLRERGVSAELLARIKGPAGLDIGAVTAIEIAVSIMAEIVQRRRRGKVSLPRPSSTPIHDLATSPVTSATHGNAADIPATVHAAHTEHPELTPGLPLALARERGSGGEGRSSASRGEGGEATDPVCGMRVAIPGARHVLEHAGQHFYFCCPSCRRLFAANPEQYLAVAPTASGEGVSSDAIPG